MSEARPSHEQSDAVTLYTVRRGSMSLEAALRLLMVGTKLEGGQAHRRQNPRLLGINWRCAHVPRGSPRQHGA
jgi:hypothetical protein